MVEVVVLVELETERSYTVKELRAAVAEHLRL
jgi:hypothetical protein